MPLGKRIERFKNKIKSGLGLGSDNASSSSLPNMLRPSPSPAPPTPRAATPPVIPVSSATTNIPTGDLSPPIITAPPHAVATTDKSPKPDEPPVPTPVTLSPIAQNTAAPVGEGKSLDHTKSAMWAGLKALLKVLETGTDVFPPLKSAVGGLNQCIDIFESASKGRNDYAELRTKLDSLLEDLSQYLGGPTGMSMTTSMKHLSIGINQELKRIQGKYKRSSVQRHAEALEDADDILASYRRIEGHLERLTLNANLSIWKIIDKQETEARLRQLLPTMSAVYNSAESQDVKRGPCTLGTREQELARLLNWAHNKEAGDIYWMNGMAGTGKTTIAYSICDELSKTAELGASFFCSRLIPECRNVKFILPAIAYQLARFSYPFRCALSKVLEADPDMHTRVLHTQFESLIVKPLNEVTETLPAALVVVIDALDECENENSVGQILDTLLAQTVNNKLPVRFLLSSRPEPEIFSRMMGRVGQDLKAQLVLHDLNAEMVKHDIKTYLQAELNDVPLTSSQFSALVDQSGVLFIYAATAARYLRDGLELMDCSERLAIILGLSTLHDTEYGIDALYAAILDAAFKNRKFNAFNRSLMKMILDTVICTQEPTTLDSLAGLLQVKNGKQVDVLLRPLRSVLNIANETGLVTTLHASFPDFMLNQHRSTMFYCDPRANHGRLAQACFDLIATADPQFNICRLESSHLYDHEVADLGKRVDRFISAHLFYACRYWIAHLELGEDNSGLAEQLHEFLSARLLLWMEVLNVKNSMYLAGRVILRAESWSRTHSCSNETIELAHDAWRFVAMYASHKISQSTPHIYVSMLPIWPKSSPISEYYKKRMRGAIAAEGTAMTRRQLALLATWSFDNAVKSACFSSDGSLIAFGTSTLVYVIDGTTSRTVIGPLEHGDPVISVAFSPDDMLVASGSEGGTIRVWSTQDKHMVVDPLQGHTDVVHSVSFSPDSTRIVSGSADKTIRVWDAKSGQQVTGPLKGHSLRVYSVCFSPDGTRVLSSSRDDTLRLWDAQGGQMVIGPLRKHTNDVKCVCFSPDGMRIASGSTDKTILLWDGQNGRLVGVPLIGHSSGVLSVVFAPDGKHIVSGSDDQTLRLWDLTSDPISSRILEGHTDYVTSVAFSSDGSRIVSCSDDKTIRVWDARSRATVADSLEGHTGTVYSVGYSPDGKHIVSGSGDKTIRMWDAESGQMVGGPLEGHTGLVRSVCFSPDGRRIVSGSDDGTIRAWDVQSGQGVVGPLEAHARRVRSVCHSPDGTLIASGSNDRTIRVWEVQDGKPVGSPLTGHDDWVRSVCFSPDSKFIASGSDDRTIRMWDVKSGQTVAGPLKGHTNWILSVCFSPGGTRLASGSADKTVRVWDGQQGQAILGPLEGHTEAINSVCFSPSGTFIVSGSDDKTVRLWDAQSGQAVGDPLVGHTGPVCSVAFSLDGKHIVSGSSDQTIRVWDVDGILRMYGAADFLPSLGPGPISPPRPHESWVLREDGWVVDRDSRLLVWVPPDLHAPLLRPHNTLRISTEGDLKLNFDPANLGESWAECYQTPTS